MINQFMLLHLHLLFYFPFCISLTAVTLNESITGREVLLSEGSIFALGFFSPGISTYKYVGIWYNKLPQKTVVWVANRENPIPRNDSSAVFTLSTNGRNLVLYSGQDQRFPIWSTNVSPHAGVACEAQLLDSGNLIFFHPETQEIFWQRFDYPTDTMLPGMKLGLNRKLGLNWFLTSCRSEDDPAVGETSFKIKSTSSPQFFLLKGLVPYWRTNPWPIYSRTVVDNSGSIPGYLYKYNFVNTDDEIYYTFFVDDKSIYTRSVVESSGLIQRLTWDNSTRQLKQSWFAPHYIYGYCGSNSIIDSNNVEI